MHILLVEDHDDTRCVLAKLLDHCGHEVAGAANMHDALLLMENFRFDALVSDIGLPDGDGLELVAEAKRRQPLRTTVALTALGSPADRQRGQEAGFDHYLTKPCDFGQLRGLLRPAA